MTSHSDAVEAKETPESADPNTSPPPASPAGDRAALPPPKLTPEQVLQAEAPVPSAESNEKPAAIVARNPRETAPPQIDQPVAAVAQAEMPEDPFDAPTAVPVPTPPPRDPIDVDARLKVPINQFEQIKGVPLKQLLQVVEELAGLPIRLRDKAPQEEVALLDRTVSVRLQNTTVGGILQSIVDQGGFTWEVRDEVIWLRKRD